MHRDSRGLYLCDTRLIVSEYGCVSMLHILGAMVLASIIIMMATGDRSPHDTDNPAAHIYAVQSNRTDGVVLDPEKT